MLSHTSLENYYVTNFELVQHHKYSQTELDELIPFEKQLYVEMLLKHLEEEKLRLEQENARR